MKQESKATVRRRDFLGVLGLGAGAVVTSTMMVVEAHADSESNDEKRKARYNADSPDVKAFYRVNHYPS